MSAFGSKLRRGEGGVLLFWCPACAEAHQVRVDGDGRPRWGFNGDPQRPTLTPSVLVRSGCFVPEHKGQCWCSSKDPEGEDWGFTCAQCHFYLTDGRLHFLSDCSHALAGQVVELPDFPGFEGAGA